MTLRAGLSGSGAAGRAVIDAVRRQHDCDVVAVHDPDPAAVQALRDERGIGCGTTDFAELLGTGVDFVVLADTGRDRVARVQAASEQAVPVLLHAPMAATLAEAEAMAAAAEAAGLPLGVAVDEMADPVFDQVRRMVADGWFGGLVAAHAFRGDDELLRHPPVAGDARLGPQAFGAGPLWRHVAVDVHLLAWLTGRGGVGVTARGARSLLPLACDAVVATATLRGNALAVFTASHVAAGRSFQLRGTDGWLQRVGEHVGLCGARAYDGDVFAYDTPTHARCFAAEALRAAAEPRRAGLDLHGCFARWLDDRDGFPCPAEQALADLRVVAAMQRALTAGTTERI